VKPIITSTTEEIIMQFTGCVPLFQISDNLNPKKTWEEIFAEWNPKGKKFMKQIRYEEASAKMPPRYQCLFLYPANSDI
jgi:hypothetical protein